AEMPPRLVPGGSDVKGPACPAPRPISRRQLLQVGAASALGLTLPRLLRADSATARAGRSARADACILVFLNGGPSHLDMWDMKPHAPAQVPGEVTPTPTPPP